MQLFLKISDSSFCAAKGIEVRLRDEEEGCWKVLRHQVCKSCRMELVKPQIKGEIMKLFGDALEKYLDKAFEGKEEA